MNKIPLELVTTLSGAPAGSPVIWDGEALVVSQKSEYNLDNLVRTIKKASEDFAAHIEANQANLQLIPQLAKQFQELKPAIDSAQRQASQVSSELSQLTVNVNAFAAKLAPIDVRISTLSNSVTAFRTSNQEALSAIASLDARVKSLESAGGLTTRMGVIESQYAEIDRRISPLETSSASVAADVQSLTARLTSVEGRLQTVEANIQSIMAQMK